MRLSAALLFLLVATGCDTLRIPPALPNANDYDQIRNAQRQTQGHADDGLIRRGQEVFLTGPCAMCHTIRGTLAGGRTGPDLTHVASRGTLAAGALANTRGHLTGWIVNPQNLKPGTKMPPTLLPSEDLHALVAFLESLK